MSELSVTKITNVIDIQGIYFPSVNLALATANSALATANASSPVAAFNQANTVNATAIAAFATANSALANSTGTFSGNLGFGLFPACKIDTAGVIRTTSTGAPASGAGLELSYGGTANTADILAYDRTNNAFKNIEMRANNVIFNVGGAGEKIRIGAAGQIGLSGSYGTSGQVLTSAGAGAAPTWSTVSATGTVTSITAGTGLSGGTITTSGTIALVTTVGAVGTYALLKSSSSVTAGSTYAGNTLQYTGSRLINNGCAGVAFLPNQSAAASPSGTWQAMGTVVTDPTGQYAGTLFIRIS